MGFRYKTCNDGLVDTNNIKLYVFSLPLDELIKYGEMYPLSNFIPSIISNSSCNVFPSCSKKT